MKRKSILRLAVKIFLDSVIATVMGFITTISISLVFKTSTFGYVISQIFTIILLFAFFYNPMWLEGDKDKNLVNFKRIEEDKYRGFKVGLIAIIPSLLLSILLILSKIGAFYNILLPYKLINSSYFGLNSLIFSNVFKVTDINWVSIIISALLPILTPLVCGLAYIFGYNRIMMIEKVVYKKPNNKK